MFWNRGSAARHLCCSSRVNRRLLLSTVSVIVCLFAPTWSFLASLFGVFQRGKIRDVALGSLRSSLIVFLSSSSYKNRVSLNALLIIYVFFDVDQIIAEFPEVRLTSLTCQIFSLNVKSFELNALIRCNFNVQPKTQTFKEGHIWKGTS